MFCDCEAGKLMEQASQLLKGFDEWFEENQPGWSDDEYYWYSFPDKAGEKKATIIEKTRELSKKAVEIAEATPCPKCGGKGTL